MGDVERLLKARTSFHCQWFQGFMCILEDPFTAEVKVTLDVKGEADHEKWPCPELVMPDGKRSFPVRDLIDLEDMEWEHFVRLERHGISEHQAVIAGLDMGPFDLEL